MASSTALPFELTRTESEVGAVEIRSTTERIHGLLRLDGDRLVVQWRIARSTELVGWQVRTDRELEPVREVVLPLHALAGAEVRTGGWRRRTQFVLTAADLRAFEEIAGAAGLKLDHPATLVLNIPRRERLPAREFAADLNLALAERALKRAEATDLPLRGSVSPVPERVE